MERSIALNRVLFRTQISLGVLSLFREKLNKNSHFFPKNRDVYHSARSSQNSTGVRSVSWSKDAVSAREEDAMRLQRVALAALVIASSFASTSARAGGWWSSIHLNGRHIGIGETVNARAEVLFRTLQVARDARTTEYYAYLARGLDTKALERAMSQPEPRRWWTPPRELLLVGDVDLSQWDSNLAMSRADLTVPDVPPGRYDLVFCDKGCRNPLGNLIPLPVQISDDTLAAQTARKLQATKERLELTVARLHRNLRLVEKKAVAAEANAEESADAIAALRKRLSSLDTSRGPSTPWVPYVAWFVTAVLIAAALRRRRSVPMTEHRTTPEQVPDDTRELVSR
jgi:hypothetical protein